MVRANQGKQHSHNSNDHKQLVRKSIRSITVHGGLNYKKLNYQLLNGIPRDIQSISPATCQTAADST